MFTQYRRTFVQKKVNSPLSGDHKRALFYLKKMHFPNKGGHTSYSLIFLSEGKPLTVCFPIQYLFTISEENSVSVVFGYHIFMCSFVYHIAMTQCHDFEWRSSSHPYVFLLGKPLVLFQKRIVDHWFFCYHKVMIQCHRFAWWFALRPCFSIGKPLYGFRREQQNSGFLDILYL